MSTAHPRQRWVAAAVAGVGVILVTAQRVRRRHDSARDDHPPTDASFMRAMHGALRRDMSRLESLAPEMERRREVPTEVRAGWTAFRTALEQHHTAEDDDLWPVLRDKLTRSEDRRQVDLMVEEHRALPPAIDSVDAALNGGVRVIVAARELGELLRRHLDHEEEHVLPLLEGHLSRREWRAFLLLERQRRSMRERPQFLTWVLDDASESDTAAVMAELPKPAHLVYRWVLRPRYQAERRWQPDWADDSSAHVRRGAA